MKKAIDDFISFIDEIGFWRDEDLDNEDEMEFIFNFGEVKIKLYPKDEIYDIYADLAYYDVNQDDYEKFDGNFENDEVGITDNLREDIFKYWLSKELAHSCEKEPDEEVDSFLMCPGSNIHLGYFGNDVENSQGKIAKFIKTYNEFLPDCLQNDYSILDAVNETIKDLLTSQGYDLVEKRFLQKKSTQIMIAPLNESFNNYISKNELLAVEEVFIGKEYFLFRSANEIFASNKQPILEFENITEILGWEFRDINYFVAPKSILYFTNKLIHGIVKLNSNPKNCRDLEYMFIEDEFRKFKNFKTGNKTFVLDFSKITPTDFEKLCYEFLIAEGFENVHPVGATNSPDGGRDIIANQVVKTNFGTEKRAYLVQCKHTKGSLKRETIGEIPSLLRENNAERYLLICSSDLSPQTIDRLDKQNNKLLNNVEYFGRIEFSMQLNKHPTLITKYKLL